MSWRGGSNYQRKDANDVRSWSLEKYTRLTDIRQNPMEIEGRPPNELSIVLNMKLKQLLVSYNGQKLEEFCISPLVHPHEVICKEMRILICVKSQVDGRANGKFRVRFQSIAMCQNFCVFISNFLKVVGYEDWYQNSSQLNASQMSSRNSKGNSFNAPMARNSSFQRSTGRERMGGNHSYEAVLDDTSGMADSTRGFGRINDLGNNGLYSSLPIASSSQKSAEVLSLKSQESSFEKDSRLVASKSTNDQTFEATISQGEAVRRVEMGMQTDAIVEAHPAAAAAANQVVNIHIDSLISDRVVTQFVELCQSFLVKLFETSFAKRGPTKPRAAPKPKIVKEKKELKRTKPKVTEPKPKEPKPKHARKQANPFKGDVSIDRIQRTVPKTRRKTSYGLRGSVPISELENLDSTAGMLSNYDFLDSD